MGLLGWLKELLKRHESDDVVIEKTKRGWHRAKGRRVSRKYRKAKYPPGTNHHRRQYLAGSGRKCRLVM